MRYKLKFTLLTLVIVSLLVSCNLDLGDEDIKRNSTLTSVDTSTPLVESSQAGDQGKLPGNATPEFSDSDEALSQSITPIVTMKVAYIKDGDVWLWNGEEGAHPLTTTGGAYNLRISDDGSVVAYLKQVDDFHSELWAVDSDGSGERRLVGVQDFEDMAVEVRDPNAVAINPYHFEWIPGSLDLAFNTHQVFQGPGLLILDDLRIVNSNTTELRTLLPPGQGGEFIYSNNGSQIAISTPTTISLVNNDGSNRRNVLVYDQVITYSEYRYYAIPQWSLDSSYLRAAIPPVDPLASTDNSTSLWLIPTEGSPAKQVGNVNADPFFETPVSFSPDLANMIYLEGTGEASENRRQLHITKPDGSGDWVYQKGSLLLFEGWSIDSNKFNFLVGENQEMQLGSLEKTASKFTQDPIGIHNVQWINDDVFIYLRESPGIFDLIIEKLDGESLLIDSVVAPPPIFDFTY